MHFLVKIIYIFCVFLLSKLIIAQIYIRTDAEGQGYGYDKQFSVFHIVCPFF